MILDCSSYESVKSSLCKIFHTTENVLLSVLQSVENDEIISYEIIKENVKLAVKKKLGEPDSGLKVLWFHGTRVTDPDSFHHDGILTKSQAKPKLTDYLSSLSFGIEKRGCPPVASCRNEDLDEGPFAYLIKIVAMKAPGCSHNYTDAPELVEEIAANLVNDNYNELVARFKEKTQPYIISFTAEPKGEEVFHALLFLKLIQDGQSELIAGDEANTCFNSMNNKISPNRIVHVENIK